MIGCTIGCAVPPVLLDVTVPLTTGLTLDTLADVGHPRKAKPPDANEMELTFVSDVTKLDDGFTLRVPVDVIPVGSCANVRVCV
jgi:hypothetical protein